MARKISGRPGPNDRPALPSGHPITWGALTDGTVIDRSEYPNPPPPDRRDDESHRRVIVLATRLQNALRRRAKKA